MVLSFFGKKPLPAGSSASRNRAASGGAAGAAAPASPRVVRGEPTNLEFTIAGGDLNRVLAQCAEKVHVEEGIDEMAPPAEEAAILYANGACDEARIVLEQALDVTVETAARFDLWVMLLDLLRLTGQRDNFEALSLMFATEFERSPSAWQDLSVQDQRSGEPKVQTVNLSGHLGGQAAAQFAQLIQIGMRNGALRIDLSRLRSVDNAGAGLLLRAVRGLRRAKIKLALSGAADLANLLAGQLKPGVRDGQTSWLLLLEILQYTEQQARFDDLAVDYAMTFEESPPSWEPPPILTTSQSEGNVLDPNLGQVYVLEGEIVGPNTDVLRKIPRFASDRTKVEVDCGRLRRMDFVSAGTLFNIVSQLHTQGRLVVFKNVNSMVAALMQVMGLHQVARIELRN